jgi:hypothetical protein
VSLLRELWTLYRAQPRRGQVCERCGGDSHIACTQVPDHDVPVLAVYTEMHASIPVTEEAA